MLRCLQDVCTDIRSGTALKILRTEFIVSAEGYSKIEHSHF